MLHIRNLEENDFEFLLDMMYEAIYIPKNKPPKEELLNSPHIKKYHEGWGRKGDRALIAFRDNQPLVLHGIAYSKKTKKDMDMLMIILLNSG
ncbi:MULTISPECIES: hypothetical protein [unclassified Geobacillus]|uniref:hypothetical protein n=1 Tax=unclassified Geobacillus TaxID=2642459 RepID=UPI001E32AE5E|nr:MULTISPECIES: hypothetical protein [unclassified Geobacillus]